MVKHLLCIDNLSKGHFSHMSSADQLLSVQYVSSLCFHACILITLMPFCAFPHFLISSFVPQHPKSDMFCSFHTALLAFHPFCFYSLTHLSLCLHLSETLTCSFSSIPLVLIKCDVPTHFINMPTVKC